MKKIELTAPAGDIDKGKLALIYGADSVYIGFPGFSLRAGAEKFHEQELLALIDFAHKNNKRVYFALNIFAHNNHIKSFKVVLDKIAKIPVDSLILSDPGLIMIAREKLPEMHITVSTQANTTNYAMIRLWGSLKVNRVVLARELSIDEIREMRQKTDLELEVFVHGAVCMAYSGRCLLSGFLTDPAIGWTRSQLGNDRARHSNLGDCVQPCRWRFSLVEENRKSMVLPIEQDQWGTYILSAQDLCLIDHLNKLAEAGVDVFKIEGRMKSLYYVCNVTRVYRRAIDLYHKGQRLSISDKEELFKVSHRGYTTGFTFKSDKSMKAAYQGYIKKYKFYALIEDVKEAPLYQLKVYNGFNETMTLEVIGPDMRNIILKKGEYKLLNNEKKETQFIKHRFDGYIRTEQNLRQYDLIRIKE